MLPFADISEDTAYAYLANGITQAVTTRLHRAGLQVIPWTTATRFASDSDPVEVARQLGVDAVLTATLQANGSGLLVTAALVDGGTGIISWTDAFEETFENASALFVVQTRIAQGVAAGLGPELTPSTTATLAKAESTSPPAYDFYLQGVRYIQAGDRDSLEVGLQIFMHAIDLDPRLAEAHVGLGTAYYTRFWNGWGTIDDLALSEGSFMQALAIDATDMRAIRGLVLVEFQRGNSEGALTLGQQAARNGLDDIETLLTTGQAYMLGGLGGPAYGLLRRVVELDPLNAAAAYYLALSPPYREVDDPGPADTYLDRFGNDPYVALVAAFTHERQGDIEGARTRYDLSTQPAFAPTADGTFADWYEITALLYAGAFYERVSQDDRARTLWRRGVELASDALASDSDNVRMRMLRASFYGFLGEDALFREEEMRARAALRDSTLSQPWDMLHLAAAHGHRGDTGRALEILGDQQRGLLIAPLHIWALAPNVWDDPGFGAVRTAHRARAQTLLKQFALPAGV